MKRISFKELVLFENDDFIVVNKPPFISTLEDRSNPVNLLALGRDSFPEIQVCHRLDKDTSGCLIFAKNPEAYRHISLQFQEHQISKVYHAIVEGRQSFSKEEVTAPIHVKSAGGAKVDYQRGKESLTYFTSIKKYRNYTLLECNPVTGRLHQIRVHCAYLECPIAGDEKYGGKPFFLSDIKFEYTKSKGEEKPLIRRFALHAYTISFIDLDGEKVTISAQYPKDFKVLLTQLGKHNEDRRK